MLKETETNLVNANLINELKANQNNSYKKFSHAFSSQFSNSLAYHFNTWETIAQSPKYVQHKLNDSIHTQIHIYELFKKFENQVVFDLGAGIFPENSYRLLNSLGIKEYFGIEPFNYNSGKNNLEKELIRLNENNKKYAPAEYIETDMKTILETIPDNSSSFLATGIDMCVIPSHEYFDICSKLIIDKLHPEGIFVSYYSDFFNRRSYFEKSYNNSIQIEELENNLIILSKKN